MTNHDLEIIMKLRDEVSKKLQGIEGGIRRFGNAAKELGGKMRLFGREISQVGNYVAMAGASITGPLLLAFKNAEKYSLPVAKQIERMKNVTLQFQVSIANALVPVMEKFTNILGSLLKAWNNLGPAVQKQIVQGAFMTGVFLTIAGVVAILGGKLLILGGTILKLIGQFLTMEVTAILPFVAITAAVAGLIYLMLRFKGVADTIISTLEILFNLFLNGIETIKLAITRLWALILSGVEKGYALLSKLPGPMKGIFEFMAESVRKFRGELDKIGDQSINNIVKNTEKMGNIFSTGEGSWSKGFDNLKNGITKTWDLLKNPPSVDIQQVAQAFNAIQAMGEGVARTLGSSFKNLFGEALHGQLRTAKDYVAEFGNAMLDVLSEVLAKMILINTIGAMFPGMIPFFHEGGMVYHKGGMIQPILAHSGLAPDEIPIIAQSGEAVLSRRGVANAGGPAAIRRLNSGQSPTGGVMINIQPAITIKAWDMSDITNHKEEIQGMIYEGIVKNGKLRSAITTYCR